MMHDYRISVYRLCTVCTSYLVCYCFSPTGKLPVSVNVFVRRKVNKELEFSNRYRLFLLICSFQVWLLWVINTVTCHQIVSLWGNFEWLVGNRGDELIWQIHIPHWLSVIHWFSSFSHAESVWTYTKRDCSESNRTPYPALNPIDNFFKIFQR